VANKKNYEVYRGDSKTITVNFSANASMLDGGTVWLTLKKQKDDKDCEDPDNLCVFQTTDLVSPVLDESSTIIGYKAELYMSPSDTGDLSIESFVYDIQVVGLAEDPLNPGNPSLVKTLVEGKFKILRDVTLKTS